MFIQRISDARSPSMLGASAGLRPYNKHGCNRSVAGNHPGTP